MSDPTSSATNPVPDEPDDDLKTLLAKRKQAKPNKATWILLALIAVAIGFTFGACMSRAIPDTLPTPPGAAAPSPGDPVERAAP